MIEPRDTPGPLTRPWLPWAIVAAGLLLLDVTLVRYTSFADRRVLGRWSPAHAGLIVIVTLAFGVALYRSLRARAQAGARTRGSVAFVSAALALLVWGLSLTIASLSDPDVGGRIVDMRLLASLTPASILLEWVVLALVVVAVTDWLRNAIARRLPPGRPSTIARNALVSLVSLASTVLVLEAALRLMAVAAPQPQGFPTRAQMLWVQRHVRLNSLGYRDVEHALEPPRGRTRILLVGDSFGHGFGINDVRERVSDRLVEALNQGQGAERRFDVINAARPDTHTVDHIAALPKVLAYKPAYVLLLYVFNDIEHVTRPPRSVVSNPSSLLGRLHPLRFLVLNSALAEQVFVRLRRSTFWNQRRAGDPDPYLDDRVLQEHLASLERFFDLCREARAEARLIPFDLRVVQAPEFVTRYRRLQSGAEARGIKVWSLEHAFDGHAHSALVVNHLDPHPNARANALAARVIVDRFRAEFAR